MSELSQIVSVSISANSTTASRQGFGTPLLLSYHTRFAERYRIYSSTAEMVSDGFATYDEAYRMASAAFRQDPTVAEVVVGRLPSAPAYSSVLTITTAVEGQIIKATVIEPTTGTAVPLTYTVPAAATTTTVATAFELLVEAVTGVSAASVDADITVTPAVAGRPVHIYDLQNCTIEETTADAGYDTELGLLQIENDDWYFVTIDSASPANVADVAAWTLTNKKLFFVGTNSQRALLGTWVGSGNPVGDLTSNDRAVLVYAKNSHEYAGVAYAVKGASSPPGSITWAFKSLGGVTAQTLTSTQRSNLETDNVNHYQTLAGISITRQGVTTEGEFIDIRHGIDALEARIKEDVFTLLANSPKVPFTASGLDLVASVILSALRAFEGTEEAPSLIAVGTSTVIMPEIGDVSTSDKAARRLTGVRFSGTLAGAIHFSSIVGTLTV